MTPVRLLTQPVDTLGEGPIWSPSDGRLYWFDIKAAKLCWYDPESGVSDQFQLPLRASAAAVRADGGLLAATEAGLARIDTATGALTPVRAFDLAPGFRTNDGKIDPQGRFWWSTMDDDGGQRPGALYRTDPGGHTELVLEDIHIANSVAFSADGSRLYLADSKFQTLFAYDTADLSRRQTFATTSGEAATPDGSAVDAEGHLWNAQWGGWRIVRYAPDGRVERVVPMPVEQPTSCAFGGKDLATLYVTSAREGLTEAALASQPGAGGLFAFEPGVTGLPLPPFQG